MSKTSLSIRMLRILYSRQRIGIAELADILETNPRNIPEYKKELGIASSSHEAPLRESSARAYSQIQK